jgi:DNA invertase Pin-like site-specific DNA recombinase
MLLFGEWPLLWVLGGNVTHFREERLHQGKGDVILFPSAQVEPDFDSTIECRERLSGRLKYYPTVRPHEYFDPTGINYKRAFVVYAHRRFCYHLAMKTCPYIAYFRVSTTRQGRSGLGLEAQQQAMNVFLHGHRELILEDFTEIESGRRNDRPQLAAALEACRKHKAVLLIAKLDRLARNVHFISGLMEMESGVEFVAVDMPEAKRLTIHILAAVAEHEREMISQRTKAALQAAKARGTTLGSPQPKKGALIRSQVLQDKADRFAANVLPIIRGLQAEGITGHKALARALNARGIQTANQRKWYGTTVKNVLYRAAY